MGATAMGLKKQFKTNDKLEVDGIVIDYGDARIRIARAGGANKKFTRLLDVRTKPYRRAIASGSMDNDRALDIMKGVFAEVIVLGWETNTGTDEEPIWETGIDSEDAGVEMEDPLDTSLLPVNKDNVLKVFRQLPDLFLDLQSQAQSSTLYRAELDEAAAGN